MVIGVVGDGIANQLYDYFFTYLFCQRYKQEFCLLEVYDYARYDFYNTIYELDVPRVPVITFDTQYFPYKDDFVCEHLVEGVKAYFQSDSVTILKTEDFVLDGPWQLKCESVLKEYEYVLLNPFVYSQLHILLENKETLLPLWKLRNRTDNHCAEAEPPKSILISEKIGKDKNALLAGINPHTVGVHVRASQQIKAYGEQAATEYFRAAIQFYREKYEDARFYIFSNEQSIAKRFIGTSEDIVYVQPDFRGVRGDFEELFLMSCCPHKIMSNGSTYSDLAVVMCDAADWSYIQARTGQKEILKRRLLGKTEPHRHYLTDKDVTRLSQRYIFTPLHDSEEDLSEAYLRFEECIEKLDLEEALCMVLKLRDQYSNRRAFHELCLRMYQGLGMTYDALVEEHWLSTREHPADVQTFMVVESDHVYGESVDLVSVMGHILHRMGYPVCIYFTDQDTTAGLYENARPEWKYRSQTYGGVQCLYQELQPKGDNPLYRLLKEQFSSGWIEGDESTKPAGATEPAETKSSTKTAESSEGNRDLHKTVLLYRIGDPIVTPDIRQDDSFVHIAMKDLNWYAPFAYGKGDVCGLERVISEPRLPMIKKAATQWNLVTQSSLSKEYYELALKILEMAKW